MRWDERVRNRRVYSDLRNPSKMCAMLCAIFDLKGASHWTSTTTQARASRIEETRRRDEELHSKAVEGFPLEDSIRDLRNRCGW